MKQIFRILALGTVAGLSFSGDVMAKTLNDIKKDFFYKQLEFEPVSATYWGVEGYDDKLRIDDDNDRAEERRYLTGLLADLETYRDEFLGTDDQIDVKIMRMSAIWELQNLEQPFPLGWRSSTDISGLVDTIYQNISRQQGKTDEWEAILKRMEKIPALIEQQGKNLERGLKEKAPFYRREVTREAMELKDEISSFFHGDVLEAAKHYLEPKGYGRWEPKLKAAADQIDRALDSYLAFVKEKVLPKSSDTNFAIGEEQYQWRLRNLLLSSETPEGLFAYGKKQVKETEQQMQKVADEIQAKRGKASKPYREVMSEIQKEAPKSDKEMFEMYQQLVDRAVIFLNKKSLFRLPKDYTIQLKETPAAYANVLSTAAMNPIPPFKDGIPAQFWITPTRNEKFPNGSPDLLESAHCFAVAPNLVVHEAVPGHDLQLGEGARRFLAGGKSDLSYLVRLRTPDIMSSLGVEGWAHYTEQLMAEQNFYTPEEHLYQLKDAQWRNVRIVVDVGIHTGRMSYSDAVDYFDEKTMSGKVTAEREIYRYSKWPLQAITYHLGKKDILDMREEARSAVGEQRFDLAQFHELLLGYDGIPVSYYRQDLLTEFKTRMIPSADEGRRTRRKRGR